MHPMITGAYASYGMHHAITGPAPWDHQCLHTLVVRHPTITSHAPCGHQRSCTICDDAPCGHALYDCQSCTLGLPVLTHPYSHALMH
eukprot:1156850-Pelagomonas_calceolata.AAC.3